MEHDAGNAERVNIQYTISKIERKRHYKPNPYHPRMLGLRCGIDTLEIQHTGWLWIEGYRDWEKYTHFHTSPVLGLREQGDTLEIETEKTVYTLTKIAEETT